MFRTALPHASRVVRPTPARRRIADSTSWGSTKWSWRFWRVVTCARPRAKRSEASASARSCAAERTPCGTFTRSICTPSWRCPYVPWTRRNARHCSASISAALANDRLVLPRVASATAGMAAPFLPGEARRGALRERDDLTDHEGARALARVDAVAVRELLEG